ncbi:MAG: hypothetical protein AAF846_20820 [Chloroflexota bacterium]
MLLLVTRRTVILLIGILLGVFATLQWAEHFHPFQSLRIVFFENGTTRTILADPMTGIMDEIELDFMSFPQDEIQDGQLVFSMMNIETRESEIQATLPIDAYAYRVARDFSGDVDVVYAIIPERTDSTQLEIYEVNLATGDVASIGLYPFENLPANAFVSEGYLYMRGQRDFVVINLQTYEIFTDSIIGFFETIHAGQYVTYEKMPETEGDTQSAIFILDLATFETAQLIPPNPDVPFVESLSWSPTDPLLLLRDENWQIWLYDAPTQTFTAIRDDIRLTNENYPWSPDGNLLLVVKSQDEATVSHGTYNLTSETLTPLFTQEQSQYGLDFTEFYRVNWSLDQRELLVIEDNQRSPIAYRIIDSRTGRTLVTRELYVTNLGAIPNVYWSTPPQ